MSHSDSIKQLTNGPGADKVEGNGSIQTQTNKTIINDDKKKKQKKQKKQKEEEEEEEEEEKPLWIIPDTGVSVENQ